MAYGRVSFWGTWPNGQNRTGLVPSTDWTAALSAAIWNTGGYTSGHRRQLGGLLVEFHVQGLDHHLSGAAGLRIHGGPHVWLGGHRGSAELKKPPMPSVPAGVALAPAYVVCPTLVPVTFSAATDADAHHHATYALLASGAAAGHGDVLPDHFPRLWVIDPLGIGANGIADHVSPLAQGAPGGVSANPLGQQFELALQGVETLDVR